MPEKTDRPNKPSGGSSKKEPSDQALNDQAIMQRSFEQTRIESEVRRPG